MKVIKVNADKILYFADIHFGIRSDSLNRIEICKEVVNQIIQKIIDEQIQHVIFAGDLFHSRVSLNVNTLTQALDSIKEIANHAHVYLILGNHDIHYKNSTDVHSIKLFNLHKNITVIEKPTEIVLNNEKKMLCVPWMGDLNKFQEESYDYIVGHFDISSKYIIASYVEEHLSKNKLSNNSENILNEIISNDLMMDGALINDISKNEINDLIENNKASSKKYLGNFINICKKSGTVLAGHIHAHRDFKIHGRRFIFIGSPQQQDFGDCGKDNGFYVHHLKSNKFNFIQTTNLPIHIELKLSDIHNTGLDNFDFSICSNNIIKLIIDTKIDHIQYSKILYNINNANPFEQFPPEYQIRSLIFTNEINESEINTHAKKIKQSKSEYLHSYIETINEKELVPNNIDKEKLYNIVMEYYETVKESENNI
jgi:DNA repair exonuclease SbcCD nuclease subunit